MESRKIQKLGPSSLFITLPKSWVEKVNLKLGDTVLVVEEPDGSLKIVPSTIGGAREKSLKVELESAIKARAISRLLTCAYILGYDSIEFQSLKEIDKGFIEELDKNLKYFMGMIMLGTAKHSVKAECLIDPKKLDEESIIKKLLSTLVDDVINVIVNNLKGKGKVSVREDSIVELRRLHNLIMRILISGSEKCGVRKAIYFVAAALFEMVTDYMLSSAEASSTIEISEKCKSISEKIIRMYTEFTHVVTDSLGSLINRSLKRALASIEASKELLDNAENLLEYIIREVKEPRLAAKLNYIVMKLIDSVSYTHLTLPTN